MIYQWFLNKVALCTNNNYSQMRFLRNKEKTINILKKNIKEKDAKGLDLTLVKLFHLGVDKDFTEILLNLLEEDWHLQEENIVELLGIIKDPRSIDKLYELAINIPDYDDMRALAKKCMWALSAIGTPNAKEKLCLLAKNDDGIIKENAIFQIINLH